nr:hypothetical protein CKG001_19080 [Bdellovibrio sp. CKG001]
MNKYLVSLFCLTLAACAPTPEEINDIKKSYSKPQMGFSGLVTVQHSEFNGTSIHLPQQISVEFEQEAATGKHLSLFKSPTRLLSLSSNEDFVSIGCNESTDIESVPANLNVDTLKICGRHQIAHNALNITANTIILDSAILEFIPTQSQQGSNRITLTSKIFWVEGKNNITLQGAKIPGGRALPPTLNLDAGMVTGLGHLKVLSKANIFSVSIK